GWSSTVRIRITLGPVLMISFRSLSEKPEAAAGSGCLVSNGPRNTQLYLGPGSEFTPDLQRRSDLFGSLAHSRQAPVPGTSAAFQDPRVNALAIVAEAQTQQRVAIRDFRLDFPGLRVPEGIAQ